MNLSPIGHQHTLGVTRRELLQVGYSGLLGLGLPTLLAGRSLAGAANRPQSPNGCRDRPYGAGKGDGRAEKVMGGGFVGIDVSKDRLDVTFTPFARHLVAHYLAIKLINRSNRHAY